MSWTETQAGESEGADLAIIGQLLINLEALQSVDRILSPFAVYLALEIASIR